MNIERSPRISDRLATNDHLSKRLHLFANVLARGRWLEDSVQSVKATQSYVERIGEDTVSEGVEIHPILSEVSVEFEATKILVEDDDGIMYSMPRYTVTTFVSQDIEKSDIPSHILDEIFKDAQDEHSEAHDFLIEAGFEDVIDRRKWHDGPDDDDDNFDQFEIKRVQEAEYTVLGDGTIEDYSLESMYSFDDTILQSVHYSQTNSDDLSRPISYGENGPTDRRPISLPDLTQSSIREYLANIDSLTETFFAEQAIRDLEVVAQLPEADHIRRIMSMVAMVSSGYVPRRWYKRAIDMSRYRLQQYHQRRIEQDRSARSSV